MWVFGSCAVFVCISGFGSNSQENSSRQGKGKGEGKGEGGKGKGGKGRGNTQKDEAAAPQVDDEKAFPALGGAPKAPDAPVQPSA